MFLMAVLVNIIYRIDPKHENISRSRETDSRWFVVLLAVMVQLVIVLSGIGMEINVGSVIKHPHSIDVCGQQAITCPNANRIIPWESNFRGPLADIRDNWNKGPTAWRGMYGQQVAYRC